MIAIKKILVPTDLSDLSVPAIGYASCLARDRDAELILLHVAPMTAMRQHFTGGYGDGLVLPADTPVTTQQSPGIDSVYEQKEQLIARFVQDKIAPDLRRGVKIRPLVKFGKVVDETIAAAKEEQCDMIVIMSEGARLKKIFGMSNTERIVQQAPCPVLSMQPAAQVRTENDQRLQVTLTDQWAA
jgi:nucleotide-binding universal stress UspA family protein